MRAAQVCGYTLVVPDQIADWDAVAGLSPWEKQRMDSIMQTMHKGDTFYDVGGEHGWMTAIYARQVGGENTVIWEPSEYLWPNIRRCFDHNNLKDPIATVEAFAGAKDHIHKGDKPIHIREWPKVSFNPECHEALPYRHPVHDEATISTVSIDSMVRRTDGPRGITIDVEGAELFVLQGAKKTLSEHRPYVWVSIHPDLMERDFDTNADKLQVYMQDQNHEGCLLRIDHEEHWTFWHKDIAPPAGVPA